MPPFFFFFVGLDPNFENNFLGSASATVEICLPKMPREMGYPIGFPMPGKISGAQISAIDVELHPAGKQT